MKMDLITAEDLQKLRLQLLDDFKEVVMPQIIFGNEWLRSGEVKKILKISAASLQNLRINGKLNPKKIGGTYYYKQTEIQKLFE